MTYRDHIELADWDGQCLLTVLDAELHDFLDDYFVDEGIEAQLVRPPDSPKKYQLLFPVDVSAATVIQLLTQIDAAEINRIVGVNQRAPSSGGGV